MNLLISLLSLFWQLLWSVLFISYFTMKLKGRKHKSFTPQWSPEPFPLKNVKRPIAFTSIFFCCEQEILNSISNSCGRIFAPKLVLSLYSGHSPGKLRQCLFSDTEHPYRMFISWTYRKAGGNIQIHLSDTGVYDSSYSQTNGQATESNITR